MRLRVPSLVVLVALAAGTTAGLDAAPTPRAVCDPASPTIYGWWPGESIAGTVVADTSGDRPGTALGAMWTPNGKVGKGLGFDGGYVLVPGTLGGGAEATLEGWVQFKGSSPGTYTIFSAENSNRFEVDASNNRLKNKAFALVQLMFDGSGASLAATVFADPSNISVAAALPNLLGFHHIAFRMKSGATALFIDGVLVSSDSSPITEIVAATDHVEIGSKAGVHGPTPDRFKGTIDELSVYTRGLSAPNIQSIVAAADAGKCAPLFPVPPDEVSLGPVVRTSQASGVSPPLCTAATPTPPVFGTLAPPPLETPIIQPPIETAPVGPDPGPRMAPPIKSFDGLRRDEQGYDLDPANNPDAISSLPAPVDTSGAVGPKHYVQMVNVAMAIYDKNGNRLCGPLKNGLAWEGLSGNKCQGPWSDGVVLYDRHADRWVLGVFAFPGGPTGGRYMCMAVSTTGDPTGSYYRYAFKVSSQLVHDYPKIGTWTDGYYFTGAADAHELNGNQVAVFDRTSMLSGQANAAMHVFLVPSNQVRALLLLPSDLDGAMLPPDGSPNYFAGAQDNGAGGFADDALQVWSFHTDWANPSASSFTRTATLPALPVVNGSAFNSQNCNGCIKQPAGGSDLSPMPNRLMFRLPYRNFGTHESIVATHFDAANSARPSFRWYELRKQDKGWTIRQQARYARDDDFNARWMASIAMDRAGDIAVGYSVSSVNLFPAIRYTGRLAGDPLNTLDQQEGTLVAGTTVSTLGAAWADYTQLTLDPLDDCTFWFTNEYMASGSSTIWRTRIGAFRFAACIDEPQASAGPIPAPKPTVPEFSGDCADGAATLAFPLFGPDTVARFEAAHPTSPVTLRASGLPAWVVVDSVAGRVAKMRLSGRPGVLEVIWDFVTFGPPPATLDAVAGGSTTRCTIAIRTLLLAV